LSADGALLIAPFFDGLNFYSVGIWNAKTGKHRGEASHCRGPLLPLPNNRLAISCLGGVVKVWNLTETAASIQRFEAELATIE
jgi:hypothetical protein